MRILAAFIIAVLTHAALLAMGPAWLQHQRPVAPRTEVTTVRLVARQPASLPEIHPQPVAPLPLPPEPEPPRPPKPPGQKPVAKPKTPKKSVPPPKTNPRPVMPEAVSPEPGPKPEMPARQEEKTTAASNAKPVPAPSAPAAPTRTPPGASAASDAATAVVLARPRYNQNPPPEYPSIAQRRRYQGTVILDVFVLKNGQVGDLRVAKSSNYSLLDRAAMKAVRHWMFDPAHKGDREVAMWVKVPIRFDLK